MTQSLENLRIQAKFAYDAVNSLWWRSDVEEPGEGSPGVPGPSESEEPWNETMAYIDAAIQTLQLVRKRLGEAQQKEGRET